MVLVLYEREANSPRCVFHENALSLQLHEQLPTCNHDTHKLQPLFQKKLGRRVKRQQKTECSDLQISQTNISFTTEQRKHIKR